MKISLILLGGIVVLSVAVARALSCVCSTLECDILTTEDCPGGLTWDPCKCCKVCARVEGEPCGGLFGFSGSCAVGLQCVIRNLLDHTREVDEGTCTKIPGRWRRHCQHGPKMSGPGCNLIGEGIAAETGNAVAAGKCVCGPSVSWCLGEPRPYTFATRHECKLNLAAKVAYDDLFSSPDKEILDGSRGSACPEDSVALEDGGCKCVSPCPPDECRTGQRPVEVRAASPETPGSCCPLYNCIPSESVSWAGTEEGQGAENCMDVSGVPRSAGERWQEGPCVNCACEEGNVSCQATMCKSCENPVPAAPGECCPHCPPSQNTTAGTPRDKCESFRDCELHCPDGYEKDEIDCPTCRCAREKPTTEKSVPEDRICPELSHCQLNCELAKDKGGCSVCICETSLRKVVYKTKVRMNDNGTVCPALSCDLHCEHGLVNDENGCTLCECKEQIGCAPLTDCKKKCSFGLKTSKRGCQICRCRATCVDHRNETHLEGSSWMPNSCTTCVCDSIGRLSCRETVCSVACSDPLPPEPGTCCPVCPITVPSSTEVTSSHPISRSWGTAPITVIVVLAVFCVLLMMHIVRSRFRGRLSPSEASYASYPPQYYKCVPAYDTPVRQSEKSIPL